MDIQLTETERHALDAITDEIKKLEGAICGEPSKARHYTKDMFRAGELPKEGEVLFFNGMPHVAHWYRTEGPIKERFEPYCRFGRPELFAMNDGEVTTDMFGVPHTRQGDHCYKLILCQLRKLDRTIKQTVKDTSNETGRLRQKKDQLDKTLSQAFDSFKISVAPHPWSVQRISIELQDMLGVGVCSLPQDKVRGLDFEPPLMDAVEKLVSDIAVESLTSVADVVNAIKKLLSEFADTQVEKTFRGGVELILAEIEKQQRSHATHENET